MAPPLRFVVYSDYLCPWCFNASVRLHRLEDAMDGQLRVEWRSYLLRPRPGGRRDPEDEDVEPQVELAAVQQQRPLHVALDDGLRRPRERERPRPTVDWRRREQSGPHGSVERCEAVPGTIRSDGAQR